MGESTYFNIGCQGQEFGQQLQNCLQERALYDPTGQKEMANYAYGLARDIQKSDIRVRELARKQKMRERYQEVHYEDNLMILNVYNGEKMVISKHILFKGRPEEIMLFKRREMKRIEWQVKVVEENGSSRMIGPLYDEEVLRSTAKLQRTFLGRYDVTGSPAIKSIAWKYMQKTLIQMFENTHIIELPSRAGWFKDNRGWHFWTRADHDTQLTNELIDAFEIKKITDVSIRQLAEDFKKLNNNKAQKEYSILWIFRLLSLVGRLTTDNSLEYGLTIIGKDSIDVAKKLLSTMSNQLDIINVDSDRINVIREKVKMLQDTPIIFVSTAPDNRSTQNRMQEIYSWLKSGYLEGTKLRIPFIFCLKHFSKTYPLSDTVLIDTDNVIVSEVELLFTKAQSMVISQVEGSGTYWIKKLDGNYKKTDKEINNFLALVNAIVDVFLSMMNQSEVDDDTYRSLKGFLFVGRREIQHQISSKTGRLLERFRDNIIALADADQLLVIEKDKFPSTLLLPIIYFDCEFYYFGSETFKYICQQAKIDKKSILSIKQQLADCDMLKIYRSSGNSGRELEIDFSTYDVYGKKEYRSGLAIKKEFFDDLGGVTLAERGKNV